MAVKRKMGPPRTDDETLRKRGSWVHKARAKSAYEPPAIVRKRVIIDDIERICRELIPGYDPWSSCSGFTFDPERARHSIEWIGDNLAHVKGEKSRTQFLLEPWQQAIMGNLFGWVNRRGHRRYREALIFVPRKNGKTPMAACIINYVLFEDDEHGMEIYGAASAHSQACKVFEHARGMVMMNPALSERCKIFNGQAKCIEIPQTFSTYRVISSEASSAHGQNTHCAVIDELHTLPDSELVEALITSTGARRQPLIVHITTSDYEREGSVCNEKHKYAGKVRDGFDDPSFLPVIYEADREEDWTHRDTWAKCNPNLGVSLSEEYLARECKRAQESPAYENTFKRLHLNIRTEQDVRWLPMDKWDACGGGLDDLEGEPCYCGLDLASVSDIAAFVMVFPTRDNAVLPMFWAPRDGARAREKKDCAPYLQWARMGVLELTDGNVTDYDVIRKRINEAGERFQIREIAFDRWNSIQLQTQLQQDGFDVVQFGQGFASMRAPTKELEKMVLSGNLRHGGNPVLRWMASNVSVELDAAGNMKPSKKRSSEKIDGIVSLVMAIGRMLVSEDDGAHFEARGLLRL